MLKHGFQAAAYPAIVGSGPMGNQWHYEDNGRQMKAGELVVMDYAGSLDYLTMDITRTWPVSGRFTDAQLKAYECVLEAQKAIIAAIKPGVARSVVQKIAEDIFKKHGFDPRYAYIGHYVGMSVHDVGDWNLPFEAGMVMAIEPIIDMPGSCTSASRTRAGDPHRRGSPERRRAERSRGSHGAAASSRCDRTDAGRCEALT